MSLGIQAAAGLVVVFVGILAVSRTKGGERTLRSFYWGDNSLGPFAASMLMLATSLSLNGLLYQSWLGYRVGVYSIVIQLFWCAGFGLLIWRLDRFLSLSRDTIHGQFHNTYGPIAGRIAALASTLGFASLAGWELSIAASILKSSFAIPDHQAIYLLFLFAFIPALYTIRGGLRGNVKINIFLNLFACAGVVALIVHLANDYNSAGAFPWNSTELNKRAKLDFDGAVVALGGAAIISNLLFSFFWQTVDMNLWENASSAGTDKKSVKWALIGGGVLVLFAPGVIGASIGMTVQNVAGINEENLLEVLVRETSHNAIFGSILFACLVAVMLSTLDGLFLSGSLSFAVDVIYPGKARHILKNGATLPEEKFVETKVLTTAYLSILLMAVIGCLLFLLVLFEYVSLFRMVYLVVIGQMSLVPGVALVLFRNTNAPASRRCGACSVAIGFVGSWALVFLSLFEVWPFRSGLLDWMPAITILLSCVGLLVPNVVREGQGR